MPEEAEFKLEYIEYRIKKLNLSQFMVENKIDLTQDKKASIDVTYSLTMQELIAINKWNKISESY